MTLDLDLDRLLAPLSHEAPSGIDLRRDQAFDLLQAALDPGYDFPKDDTGREIQVPKPRDYPKIRREALTLLGRGRELRVLVILTEALVATDGPTGLAAGLTLIRRSLEAHWDHLYPELDPEGPTPAVQADLRLGILRELAAPRMRSELGRMRLADVPGRGSVGWRQWELASGAANPLAYEKKVDLASLEAVLKGAGPEATSERVGALDLALAEVAAIDRVLAERIGDTGFLQDVGPLTELLAKLRSLLAQHGGTTPMPAATSGTHVAAANDPMPAGVPARVDSREEVLHVLDLAIEYYRRREPGSPIPLLLERARRLVPLSFLEVVADLAPEATKQIRGVLGAKE